MSSRSPGYRGQLPPNVAVTHVWVPSDKSMFLFQYSEIKHCTKPQASMFLSNIQQICWFMGCSADPEFCKLFDFHESLHPSNFSQFGQFDKSATLMSTKYWSTERSIVRDVFIFSEVNMFCLCYWTLKLDWVDLR